MVCLALAIASATTASADGQQASTRYAVLQEGLPAGYPTQLPNQCTKAERLDLLDGPPQPVNCGSEAAAGPSDLAAPRPTRIPMADPDSGERPVYARRVGVLDGRPPSRAGHTQCVTAPDEFPPEGIIQRQCPRSGVSSLLDAPERKHD